MSEWVQGAGLMSEWVQDKSYRDHIVWDFKKDGDWLRVYRPIRGDGTWSCIRVGKKQPEADLMGFVDFKGTLEEARAMALLFL